MVHSVVRYFCSFTTHVAFPVPAMAGHFRNQPPVGSQHYGDYAQFSGFMKPSRFEGEVQNLEVHGEIPQEIDGVFYRVMPDPQFPAFVENDPVCAYPAPNVSSC